MEEDFDLDSFLTEELETPVHEVDPLDAILGGEETPEAPQAADPLNRVLDERVGPELPYDPLNDLLSETSDEKLQEEPRPDYSRLSPEERRRRTISDGLGKISMVARVALFMHPTNYAYRSLELGTSVKQEDDGGQPIQQRDIADDAAQGLVSALQLPDAFSGSWRAHKLNKVLEQIEEAEQSDGQVRTAAQDADGNPYTQTRSVESLRREAEKLRGKMVESARVAATYESVIESLPEDQRARAIAQILDGGLPEITPTLYDWGRGIAGIALQQLPQLTLAVGATAAEVALPGAGSVVGAIAAGAMEYGHTVQEEIRTGIDPQTGEPVDATNPEARVRVLEENFDDIHDRAITRAGWIGAFELVSPAAVAYLARGAGKEAFKKAAIKAVGSDDLASRVGGGIGRRAVMAATVEPATEMTGELLAQQAEVRRGHRDEVSRADVVLEGVVGLPGGSLQTTAAAVTDRIVNAPVRDFVRSWDIDPTDEGGVRMDTKYTSATRTVNGAKEVYTPIGQVITIPGTKLKGRIVSFNPTTNRWGVQIARGPEGTDAGLPRITTLSRDDGFLLALEATYRRETLSPEAGVNFDDAPTMATPRGSVRLSQRDGDAPVPSTSVPDSSPAVDPTTGEVREDATSGMRWVWTPEVGFHLVDGEGNVVPQAPIESHPDFDVNDIKATEADREIGRRVAALAFGRSGDVDELTQAFIPQGTLDDSVLIAIIEDTTTPEPVREAALRAMRVRNPDYHRAGARADDTNPPLAGEGGVTTAATEAGVSGQAGQPTWGSAIADNSSTSREAQTSVPVPRSGEPVSVRNQAGVFQQVWNALRRNALTVDRMLDRGDARKARKAERREQKDALDRASRAKTEDERTRILADAGLEDLLVAPALRQTAENMRTERSGEAVHAERARAVRNEAQREWARYVSFSKKADDFTVEANAMEEELSSGRVKDEKAHKAAIESRREMAADNRRQAIQAKASSRAAYKLGDLLETKLSSERRAEILEKEAAQLEANRRAAVLSRDFGITRELAEAVASFHDRSQSVSQRSNPLRVKYNAAVTRWVEEQRKGMRQGTVVEDGEVREQQEATEEKSRSATRRVLDKVLGAAKTTADAGATAASRTKRLIEGGLRPGTQPNVGIVRLTRQQIEHVIRTGEAEVGLPAYVNDVLLEMHREFEQAVEDAERLSPGTADRLREQGARYFTSQFLEYSQDSWWTRFKDKHGARVEAAAERFANLSSGRAIIDYDDFRARRMGAEQKAREAEARDRAISRELQELAGKPKTKENLDLRDQLAKEQASLIQTRVSDAHRLEMEADSLSRRHGFKDWDTFKRAQDELIRLMQRGGGFARRLSTQPVKKEEVLAYMDEKAVELYDDLAEGKMTTDDLPLPMRDALTQVELDGELAFNAIATASQIKAERRVLQNLLPFSYGPASEGDPVLLYDTKIEEVPDGATDAERRQIESDNAKAEASRKALAMAQAEGEEFVLVDRKMVKDELGGSFRQLEGMHVSKDVLSALRGVHNIWLAADASKLPGSLGENAGLKLASKGVRAVAKANLLHKTTLLFASLGSYSRNAVGAGFYGMLTGAWFPAPTVINTFRDGRARGDGGANAVLDLAERYRSDMGAYLRAVFNPKAASEEQRQRIAHLVDIGVIQGGYQAREIVSMAEEIGMAQYDDPNITFDEYVSLLTDRLGKWMVSKFGAPTPDIHSNEWKLWVEKQPDAVRRKLVTTAAGMWGLGDDIVRLSYLATEEAALAGFKKYEHLSDSERAAAVEAEAARRLTDQMPTYRRTPNGVLRLSRNAPIGPWAPFSAEVPRTVFNVFSKSAQDVREGKAFGDSRQVAHGLWRMGMASATIGLATSLVSGTTAFLVTNALGGVIEDLDPEEEEAARAKLPPYWQDQPGIVWYRRPGERDLRFVVPDRHIPWADYNSAIYGAMRGNHSALVRDPLSAFIETEPFLGILDEVASNRSHDRLHRAFVRVGLKDQIAGSSRIVDSPDAMPWSVIADKYSDKLYYGLFPSDARLMYEWGNDDLKSDPEDNRLFFLGLRGRKVAARPSREWTDQTRNLRNHVTTLRDIRASYLRERGDANYDAYNTAHAVAWSEASREVEMMRRAGFSEGQVFEQLVAAGFSKRDSRRLQQNQTGELRPRD